MKPIQDKDLINLLLKSIKEICVSKEKIIKNYEEYPVHINLLEVLQLDTEEKYIHFYEHNEQGKVFSIKKPIYTSCPKPNDIIINWLNLGWDDYMKNPQHKEYSDETGENFEDVIERVEAYQQWIKCREKWVIEQKKLRQIDRFFMKFYRINDYFRIDTEDKELLFAFGLFRDAQKHIAHPLFTKRLRIDDEDIVNNIITLYDGNDNVKFDSTFLRDVDTKNFGRIIEKINTEDINVYSKKETADFLRGVIHWLSPQGEYSEADVEDFHHNDFIVTYSPIIIMREPKSGLVDFMDKIQIAIDEGAKIPPHLIDILHPTDKPISISGKEHSVEDELAAISGEDENIYMTKPANKEQLRIAQEIERNNAVEVQGPPGTGKTHTIANLIGHFLAQGKTVLVTSEKVKALTVLKDKLEEQIQPLCVPVFHDNQHEMEYSINSILGKINQIHIDELKHAIVEYRKNRENIINTLNEERKKIFEIRNREAKNIVYDGNSYSVLDVAEFLDKNKGLLTYILGNVEKNPDIPLPIEDFQFLYESNEKISYNDCIELSLPLPSYQELMLPEKFKQLLQEIDEYNYQLKQIKDFNFDEFTEDFENDEIIYRDKVIFSSPKREVLYNLQHILLDIMELTDWQIAIIQDAENNGGYLLRWEKLLGAIDRFSKAEECFVGNSVGVIISMSPELPRDLLKDNLNIISHKLQENGHIGKLYRFTHGKLNKVLEGVHINAHEIQNSQEADLVLEKISRDEAFERLQSIWNDVFKDKNVKNIDDMQDNLVNYIKDVSNQVRKAIEWESTWHAPYMDLLLKSGFNQALLMPKEKYSLNIARYIEYLRAEVNRLIKLALIYSAKRQVRCEIRNAEKVFLDGRLQQSVYCKNFLQSIENYDIDQYTQAYKAYVTLCEKYPIYEKREDLLQRLSQSAPLWAQSIRSRKGVHGEGKILYDIRKAWKTKQFDMIFTELFSESLVERQNKVTDLSAKLREITATLASDMAWLHLKYRLEGKKEIQSNLASWISLIKRIGKGTGKNVPIYRAQAKQCMLTGQKAIPAWIVPVKKALEIFDPVRNRFDIAIVDEASQSSLEALVITFLADKIIVVGDDKQVSPMNIGIDSSNVNAILKKYLAEYVKNWSIFDGRTSFYEIVGTVFQPLMLREHFRCVSEIIGYSNEKFYNNQILPLRDASSSQLIPPVINYRVDGTRRKNKVNEEEAETIVSLIMACCEQKEYEKKTFGVISLLGDEQAQRINDMISQYIGNYSVIKDRMLIAGNAASFQGDERDVIFLSLVDDMKTVRKATKDDIAKRFNVAVSRAKDQLWVINSLEYTVLQTDDLKYGLLEYVTNYKAHRELTIDIQKKSESPFEYEVAQFLATAGYHFIQQYEVGAYRIDIVVVYDNNKIAIECDGERYHSGELKIQQDMERQCILERLGWRFIRISGGIFYRDKEGTMEGVYQQLQNYGIYPEEIKCEKTKENSNLLEKVKRRAREIRKSWHDKDDIGDYFDRESSDNVSEDNATYGRKVQMEEIDSYASLSMDERDTIDDNSFKGIQRTIVLKSKSSKSKKRVVSNMKKKEKLLDIPNAANEGDIVIHKRFGEGVVESADGDYINVVFEDKSSRRFQIPQAFKAGFLKLKKNDKQRK